MPGERTIDLIDNQTKPKSVFNALPRPLSSSLKEQNQALIIYPGGAELNALSRPLSSSPGDAELDLAIYPGGANLNALSIKLKADPDTLPRLFSI